MEKKKYKHKFKEEKIAEEIAIKLEKHYGILKKMNRLTKEQ